MLYSIQGTSIYCRNVRLFAESLSYCDMDISECYFFINDPQIISRNDHFDYWGYIIYNNNLPWDKIDLFTLWKDKVDWKEAVDLISW